MTRLFVRMTAVLSALFMFLGAASLAGEPQTVLKRGQPDVAPSDYILGPDDQISLWAPDAEELNGKVIRIGGTGMVTMPMAGTLKAAGLTTSQLAEEVARRLERYFKKPQIVVSVSEYRSQPVSIIGAVNKPGVHQLQGRKTLIEMLSMAEGTRQDAGHSAVITRRAEWGAVPLPGATMDPSGEFSTAQVDLASITEAENPARNITIRPQDIISVPKARMVYVVGEVERAGGFVLNDQKGISVLQALSLAGGLKPTASPKNAKILRPNGNEAKREEVPVNLTSLLAGRSNDLRLAPDEVLFIPNSQAKRAGFRAAEAVLQTLTGVAIWRVGSPR